MSNSLLIDKQSKTPPITPYKTMGERLKKKELVAYKMPAKSSKKDWTNQYNGIP
jgi:hypothetical protein